MNHAQYMYLKVHVSFTSMYKRLAAQQLINYRVLISLAEMWQGKLKLFTETYFPSLRCGCNFVSDMKGGGGC